MPVLPENCKNPVFSRMSILRNLDPYPSGFRPVQGAKKLHAGIREADPDEAAKKAKNITLAGWKRGDGWTF